MEKEVRNMIVRGLTLSVVVYSIDLSIRIYRKQQAKRNALLEEFMNNTINLTAILKAGRDLRDEMEGTDYDEEEFHSKLLERIEFEKIALRENK